METLKILYLTTSETDYLQDSILIGLRQLLGNNLIDFPKKHVLYKTNNKKNIYGKGFTLYNYLEDILVDRENIKNKIINNEFDFIFFSSIHRQISLLKELYPILRKKKVVFLDGEDHPSLFAFNGKYWRNPKYWFLPKVHKKFIYFKREYTPETIKYRYYKLIPDFLIQYINLRNIIPISFAFPSTKIIKEIPKKEKLFQEHIVDEEIARILKKQVQYVFDLEIDYYKDLRKSRYGITTKRSGWDAIRHYEIAANGTIPCFKNLHLKPDTCAPHGLNETNCIIYSDYKDLMVQIGNINDDKYIELQKNVIEWVNSKSTISIAKQIIEIINAKSK